MGGGYKCCRCCFFALSLHEKGFAFFAFAPDRGMGTVPSRQAWLCVLLYPCFLSPEFTLPPCCSCFDFDGMNRHGTELNE